MIDLPLADTTTAMYDTEILGIHVMPPPEDGNQRDLQNPSIAVSYYQTATTTNGNIEKDRSFIDLHRNMDKNDYQVIINNIIISITMIEYF